MLLKGGALQFKPNTIACGYCFCKTWKLFAFSWSTESGGGTSAQLTWPEFSADSRVFGSGIGSSVILSTFGGPFQYSALGVSSMTWPSTYLDMTNGPVPVAWLT